MYCSIIACQMRWWYTLIYTQRTSTRRGTGGGVISLTDQECDPPGALVSEVPDSRGRYPPGRFHYYGDNACQGWESIIMVDQPYCGQRRDGAVDASRTTIAPGRSEWTDGALGSVLVQGLNSVKNMETRPDG